MRRLVILILLAVVAGLAVNALPAGATFPGSNGKIAFRGDWGTSADIWVMNPDGSDLTQLTTDTGADSAPAWSGGGDVIAFVSDRSTSLDIWLMNADGSAQTRLTTNAAAEGNPTWSPDGSKIAYESHRPYSDIYTINTDGSGETNLTNHADWNDWDPDWCADGGEIVFASDRDGQLEIYRMNPNGSGQTRLTTAGGDQPSCSPDSTKIAFMSERDGNQEIYVMNLDGSAQTRLTNDQAWDREPAWSPDGTKIAFRSDRGENADIWVMNADGSGQTAAGNPGFSTGPDWQPAPYPRASSEHMWVELTFDSIHLDRDSPHDCALETDVPGPIKFEGDGLFARSDPYLSGGKWTVDTEILSMNLVGKVLGYDVTLRAGAGSGAPVLNESIGKIQEQTADSGGFPADSFFDVFFEVTTGDPALDVMRNCDDVAVHFAGVTHAIPAENVAYTVSGDLINACGEWECITSPGPLGGGPAPMSPGWHSTGGSGDAPSGSGAALVVGGIAEWPDTAAGPDSSMGSPSDSAFNYTVLGGALAATAAAVALAAGACLFVRRRWLT
jgi:hypothetical protein